MTVTVVINRTLDKEVWESIKGKIAEDRRPVTYEPKLDIISGWSVLLSAHVRPSLELSVMEVKRRAKYAELLRLRMLSEMKLPVLPKDSK